MTSGKFYEANFGEKYINNGLNKLNFALNYSNFEVIDIKLVYMIDPWGQYLKSFSTNVKAKKKHFFVILKASFWGLFRT